MRRYKTIIVGGGISGLGCGYTLNKAGEDFLLISKELGGRMLTSKDNKVNYGASYITSEYKLSSKFIDKGERIHLSDSYFFDGKNWTTIYRLKNLVPFLKARSMIKKLLKNIRKFRKRSLKKEQKDCLTPFMQYCISTNPKVFIKAKNLGYLHKYFAKPVLESTFFTTMDKVNLFEYFVVLFPGVLPTYRADFTHTVEKLTNGWDHKIKIISALSMKKEGSGYILKTSKGSFKADNVVLALPHNQAKNLWKVPKPKFSPSCYAWHVKGSRKEAYQKKKIYFFDEKKNGIYCIWGQENGTDLIFSKKSNPGIKRFYSSHKVIKKIYWDPAVIISDKNWVKQRLAKNLFIAGDYNVSSLEDSFITGVYAANQIIDR